MAAQQSDRVSIQAEQDVVLARKKVKDWATNMGFSLVEQTKLVTAASELARNMLVHAGGGEMTVEILEKGIRRGLRLTFEDQGPGIADITLAMTDGYTSGSGMGLGLGGAKRLVDEFEIQSELGQGTRVIVTRWK